MTDAKPMSRRALNEKIVALAWKDEAFRTAFLADAKGEFEKTLGTKLPASLAVTAYAEDDSHLHFVIPAKPGRAGELSDGDLDKVAGGVDILTTGALISVITMGLGATTVLATQVNDRNKAENQQHW